MSCKNFIVLLEQGENSLFVCFLYNKLIFKVAGYRASQNLFLALVPPYNPVGSKTLSRWLTNLLSLSGIDVSKLAPHSQDLPQQHTTHMKIIFQLLRSVNWLIGINSQEFIKSFMKDL